VRATPDGYTLLLVGLSNAINAKEAQFQFHPRNSAGREHWRRPLCHGYQSIRSSQDGPGVHRLRQGQSEQDQHGIVRQRVRVPCLRRAVQDDDRYRPGPRSVSRRLVPDLLSGQVQVVFGTISSCIQYIRSGMLHALAVTTATRSDVLPDIPTLAEFVPGYEASTWFGIVAPSNTPTEIIQKLNNAINAGLANPKIKVRLAEMGGMLLAGSPAEFGKLIADETEKWGKVIRAANIKPQ